jgi:tetratricopeptide (TPR) repeat protein
MAARRDIYEQAMTRGHSAAWDQQWDKAIACYRAALTEFPDDPKALTSLGLAMVQSDKVDEALAIYQRAAQLTPGDPVAPEKVGEIFERTGRLNEAAQTYMAVAEIHLTRRDVEKAIENWDRVARLTPDNLNAHSRLALAYERSNRTHPSVLQYLEVARIFQRGGEGEKALQAANRAQQLEPQSPEARDALDKLRRGVALPIPKRIASDQRGGHDFVSADQLEALSEVESSSGAAKVASPLAAAMDTALGELAELVFEDDADTSKLAGSMGALARGTGMLRDPAQRRAQAIMYLGQAVSAQTSGDAAAAVNNLENASKEGVEHPAISFMLGALYLGLKKNDDAIKRLKIVMGHQELGVGACCGLGEAYARAGKTKEAFGSYFEALKRIDQQLVLPQKRSQLTEAYETLADGILRQPEEELGKLVKNLVQLISGEGWEERLQQARKNLDANAPDGTVSPLADLLATQGADKVLESMRRIETFMRRAQWATAMEEAFWALEFAPTHLPVHVRMAEILMAERKTDAAATKYSTVAEAYRVRGEPGRAAGIMAEVLRLSPLNLEVRKKLIDMLLEQGNVPEALGHFMELADTYYQLTDVDAAHAAYHSALQLAQRSGGDKSWSVKILHKIADIDMQRLAWRDALKDYEQIKTMAPTDDKARAMLVDLHYRLGNAKQALAEVDLYIRQLTTIGQGAKALGLLDELVQNYPDDAGLLGRLAKLYADVGRKAEAVAQYDRLGEIQLQSGDNTAAAQTIQAIINLGPEDPSGYQQLLAQLQGKS